MEDGNLKFKRVEVSERKRRHFTADWYEERCPEMPDEYWKEFERWCKDHLLDKYERKAKRLGKSKMYAIGLRRISFLKKINRRNKGFHKNIMRSGINLFDPVTGKSFVSASKMKKYVEKRMEQYDEKRKEFVKMLDSMVEKGQISEDMAIGWMEDTKEARDRISKRYKTMQKRIKDGQKEHGKTRDDYEHSKKYNKDRDEFFKKFNYKPDSGPFKIVFDGEETTVTNVAKKGQPPIWRLDRADGRTDYKG